VIASSENAVAAMAFMVVGIVGMSESRFIMVRRYEKRLLQEYATCASFCKWNKMALRIPDIGTNPFPAN
jgi:hypothetical protein